MSGFLNGIKKNLGLGGAEQAGNATDSTGTAKPIKKKGSAYFLELDDAKGVGNSGATAAPSSNGATAAPITTAQPAPPKAEATAKPETKPEAKVVVAPTPVSKPATPVVKQAATFAPDYLIAPSSASGRRRPGANMSYFLNLAKQAKIPGR
ncbi:MAG: hypothetical protein ACKO24_08665 [Leptolyngbyaceae cyanobacterium]